MAGVAESGTNSDAERTEIETETDAERTRLGEVAASLAAVAFVAVAGVPGLAGAAAVAGGWYLSGGTYAFALGQVALVALLAGGPVTDVAVVEASLFGVLLAPATALDRAVRPAVLAVGWVLAGGVLAWASDRMLVELSVASVVLVAATALVAYGLHRYQRVTLGTVGDARE